MVTPAWSTTCLAGAAAATLLLAAAPPAHAQPVPFPTTESGRYLLVGMGPVNTVAGRPGVGTAVAVSNFELGANKAPVPSTSGFLTGGGSSGGPGLLGNVPNIPLNARPVHSGIGDNGNVAVTHASGAFNLQDVGVYGDLGVRTAGPRTAADAGTQNSFFNDPNHYPNTFTPTGFTNPGVNNNTGGFGTFVGPGAASPAARMDAPTYAGVTGNADFTPLHAELAAARAAINALPATGQLNAAATGGTLNTHTTITLNPGLNVIDIFAGGSDFKLDNMNLVIDGDATSFAVFRVPHASNMLISNSNVLVGAGGIREGAVVFYTDRPDNAQHFNFDNTVINGVAFWSLGALGGEININNAQGCTQLIADKINLNDVRFMQCAVIPAPGAAAVLALAGAWVCRRRRR